MQCLCSGELLRANETVQPIELSSGKDCSTGTSPSQNGGNQQYLENGNFEEAESTLREGVSLNNEEARALLGRMEYQRGNVEGALRVFDGIDISAVVPKMKISIARKADQRKVRSHWDAPPMSFHAVCLLMETIYLKARALHDLGKFEEAAKECNIILDVVQATLPEGLPGNLESDCRLSEIVSKAVEFVPTLWRLAGDPMEAISSYRRGLIGKWNLDISTITRIQKEFAVFLLFGGFEANSSQHHSQNDNSFVPQNNLEEAILLLLILLRNMSLSRVKWDWSVMHYLSFALPLSGQLNSLAKLFEGLLPGVMDKKDHLYTLALCYFGEKDDTTALNLLRQLLRLKEKPSHLKGLLLASKICGEKSAEAFEGALYARRALEDVHRECDQLESVVHFLLGVSLSTQATVAVLDSDRVSWQHDALEAFGNAENMMQGNDYSIFYSLSVENAEQRKLDAALYYGKKLLRLEAGMNINVWLLLARILSAQKRYSDAETLLNAALDQTVKTSHGELLSTKAKVQIAQEKFRDAVESYSKLLAVIQLKAKASTSRMKYLKGAKSKPSLNLEVDAWYNLAHVYISMSQWRDAEACISKLKAMIPNSALFWHATGKLYEARGLLDKALEAHNKALDQDPSHVPSMVSSAIVLQQISKKMLPSVGSLLTEARCLDRMSHVACYHLGLHHASAGSIAEAAECFQAACFLEETAPVEPFR